jgi:hypothetical protein
MAPSRTLCLGMDVPQDALAVASGAQAHGAEVSSLGTIGTRQADIDPLICTRQSTAPPLFVSDAGPGGYWLDRSWRNKGAACWGVAPAWRPKQAGAHVNTARRDAGPLARLMRAGALTPGYVPNVAEEARRALPRAWEEPMGELTTATCRRKAFVRRPDIRYPGRATWGPVHRRWLAAVVGPPRRSTASARHTAGL